jgi:hypothetical protein
VSKSVPNGISREVRKFMCIVQERVEWRTFVDAVMKVLVHEQVINL